MNSKVLLASLIFLAVVSGLLIYYSPLLQESISQANVEDVREYVQSFGPLAPLAYFVLYVLQAIVAPIPGPVLIAASVILFGFWFGFLLSYFAGLTGALLSFWISRKIGRPLAEKVAPQKLKEIDRFFEKYGKISIFLLRIFPIFPFDLVSYFMGLTNISIVDYTLATAFGLVPAILLYTSIGESLRKGNIILFVILTAIAFLAFVVLPYFLNKVKRK